MSHVIGRRNGRETYPVPPFGGTPPFTPVLQPQWYVDEQDVTGKASDSNDGATANTPLLTELTIAGANDFKLVGKTVARAWDDTTGAYTEAGGVATRATTWAHLAGSIASGGFAGNAIDVATGASIVST